MPKIFVSIAVMESHANIILKKKENQFAKFLVVSGTGPWRLRRPDY